MIDNGHMDRADWPLQWKWRVDIPASVDRDRGISPFDPLIRRAVNQNLRVHYTADGHPIVPGEWYWDNNLEPVQILEIAASVEGMPGREPYGEVAWHKHTRGISDGSRLAKYWRGKSASAK